MEYEYTSTQTTYTTGENPYTEKEWDEMMQEYQMESDGQIDYHVLIELMCAKDPTKVG